MIAEILTLHWFHPGNFELYKVRQNSVSLKSLVFAFSAVTRICYYHAVLHRRTAVLGRAVGIVGPRKRQPENRLLGLLTKVVFLRKEMMQATL